MLEILPQIFQLLDEPLADPSIIPTYLLSQFTRQYVAVALGGDGGDELFAGYPTFQAHLLADFYLHLPKILRHSFLEPLAKKLPVSHANISFDFKVKRFLRGVYHNPYIRQQIWLGAFTPSELQCLLLPEIQRECELSSIYFPLERYLKDLKGTPLENILYLYSKLYLQDDILVKVDRASMAHSLEARAPFLDFELVEFIQRIPMKWKLHGLTTKYLLKRILRNKLPHSILQRPKKGFGIPVAQWLRSDLKPLIAELFSQKRIEKEGLFSYPYIKSLIQEHLNGQKNHRKQIWALCAFEMWRQHYGPKF